MTNDELKSVVTRFPVFGAKRSVGINVTKDHKVVIPIGVKLTVHYTTNLNSSSVVMELLPKDNEQIFGTKTLIPFNMDIADIEFIGYENKPR